VGRGKKLNRKAKAQFFKTGIRECEKAKRREPYGVKRKKGNWK
jgi:hypothetical protein